MKLKRTDAPLYLKNLQKDLLDLHWTTEKYLATHVLDPEQTARLLKDLRYIDCEMID